MSRRILNEPEASSIVSDDYVYMDSQTEGARKILANAFVESAQATARMQGALQGIEEEVEGIEQSVQNTAQIVGDPAALDTEAKADLVSAVNEVNAAAGAANSSVAALSQTVTGLSYVSSVTQVTGGIQVIYRDGTGEIIPVASGVGGLAFDGGYQDEEGYLHLTLEGEDIEGFDPILLNVGGGGGGDTGSRSMKETTAGSSSWKGMERTIYEHIQKRIRLL